eukprot:c8658_g1_i1.p1 GENE.c8658_g1_i1~~c8658_g1_i1.p1  ORF type:complete len:217 (+),score=50.46 c8658_g1_i1:53-703(+)
MEKKRFVLFLFFCLLIDSHFESFVNGQNIKTQIKSESFLEIQSELKNDMPLTDFTSLIIFPCIIFIWMGIISPKEPCAAVDFHLELFGTAMLSFIFCVIWKSARGHLWVEQSRQMKPFGRWLISVANVLIYFRVLLLWIMIYTFLSFIRAYFECHPEKAPVIPEPDFSPLTKGIAGVANKFTSLVPDEEKTKAFHLTREFIKSNTITPSHFWNNNK